jgi:hypothetical protein
VEVPQDHLLLLQEVRAVILTLAAAVRAIPEVRRQAAREVAVTTADLRPEVAVAVAAVTVVAVQVVHHPVVVVAVDHPVVHPVVAVVEDNIKTN